MEVFQELFFPGHTTIAATLVLYSFVMAAGIYLGKIKFFGVSLGVTFVLFVGIVMGQIGYKVDPNTLKFVRDLGLILFIFSIGLQVGPGFFSSFKRGGVLLNGLSVLAIIISVVMVVLIYYFGNINDKSALIGVMSGAITNTPGLAVAQQSVSQAAGGAEQANIMAQGYAAAYPLGVVGVIFSIFIIKGVFRINTAGEEKQIEDEAANSQLKPHILTIRVTNKMVDGRTLQQLHNIIQCNFVVSRMMEQGVGETVIPRSTTQIHTGDLLLIVCSEQDLERLHAMLGPEEEKDWETIQAPVYSRRIVVTKSEYDGVTLGSLRLHNGYRLNATRVMRAGVALLASPNLRLQLGDRIIVVGDLDDIERLGQRLGNSMKRLNQPNLITIYVGILFGIVLGSLDIGYGMKLGMAGGPLIVAILISRFGYRAKLITYTSTSASMMLRELGITLFLASVGIAAGDGFVENVFNVRGMWWVIWGFAITVVPLLIVGFIARRRYHINFLTIMGLIAGATTDAPALASVTNSMGNDQPAVAYSTVYPLTMFLRVVAAQALVLILP